MNSQRPKIKVPLEPLDVVLEIMILSTLVLLIIYTFMSYNEMPDRIPTHFNIHGEADGFGSKNTMWLLSGIGVVIYMIFSILNKYPHLHNYNINISEENALKNYRFSSKILRYTLLFVMALLFYVQFAVVSYVNDHRNVFGNWFVPIIVALSILLPIIIYIKSKKMNKS